jgi:hypothetical protein
MRCRDRDVWHPTGEVLDCLGLFYDSDIFKPFLYIYCDVSFNIWSSREDGRLMAETCQEYNNI